MEGWEQKKCVGPEPRGSPEAPRSQLIEMEKADGEESQAGVGSRRGAGERKVEEREHREATGRPGRVRRCGAGEVCREGRGGYG